MSSIMLGLIQSVEQKAWHSLSKREFASQLPWDKNHRVSLLPELQIVDLLTSIIM